MSGTTTGGTTSGGTMPGGTGTMDPGDKSAAQIEREVEGTRARLAQNLEALRESVSPGHLMDQAMDYVRGSGGTEFAQNLGRVVRDNPLPVVLIGAGLGWLLLSGNKSSGSGAARPASSSATVSYRTVTEGGVTRVVEVGRSDPSATSSSAMSASAGGASMTERAGAAAGGMADRVGDAAGQAYRGAADAAGSAADSVASTAGAITQRVSEAAGAVARGAADLGQDLRHQASRAGGQAQGNLDWLLREQPLVVGAVGVALGAALGALLPNTETEDRLMGEASDALTRQVKDAAGEGYERVQQVAGEQIERAKEVAAGAYDSTKAQADQSGLSAGKVADAVGSAAQQVREAVREGAQTVAGQARDALDRTDPPKGTTT